MLPLTLLGCSSVNTYIPFYPVHNNEIESILVHSDTQSNQNVPVSMDILFIYQNSLMKSIKNLTSPAWFKNKQAFLLSFQHSLDIVHLEVVPQTAPEKVRLPDNYAKAVQVILFANYINPKGQYQANLSQFKKLEINLHKDDYSLEEQSK